MAELLAPAGSADHVKAAIAAGADAVYLGGKAFNARKYAHNLDNDELKASVETAHLFGVKVYVTVNILISDAEMGELTEYIRFLDEIDTDGIIVQDLAVAAVARKVAPNLPLHGISSGGNSRFYVVRRSGRCQQFRHGSRPFPYQ